MSLGLILAPSSGSAQFPLVRPYTSAGVVYRKASHADGSGDHGIGLGLGLGMDADVAGVRAFAEGRLQIIDSGLLDVWRFGVLFSTF